MQETSLTFQDSEHHTVAAILAEPESQTGRAVILCHGFLSNKDSRTNLRLTELLVAQGISTLRFDWFGMGESEGEFGRITVSTCCDQLERAISLMRERGYHELGLIGSSFGGLLAILVAHTILSYGPSASSVRFRISRKCWNMNSVPMELKNGNAPIIFPT